MEVFDVHHHIGALHDAYWEQPTAKIASHHREVLDRLGIDACAVMPTPTYTNPAGLNDTRAVNDQIAALIDKCPDVFPVGFGTVEPLYGEAGFTEIDRVIEELDLDGLMWHNRWQSEYVDAEIMHDFVERVATHDDAVVMLHAHSDSEMTAPWRIFDVVEAFPGVQFLVVDAFSSVLQTKQVVSELRHRHLPNLVFDTALVTNVDRQLTRYLDILGEERLLFGSDLYSHVDEPYTPRPVEGIRSSDLTAAQQEQLFIGNACRLFDI
jgi:predicted TIM-barrel fold metal-dependent hydrolase